MDGSLRYLFVETFGLVQKEVYQTAQDKGWYEVSERNLGEQIALMHSELSEALEAIRRGNPMSEKILGFTLLEEELADTIIRIIDMAAHQRLNLARAILTKADYNKTRPHRHGGKAF